MLSGILNCLGETPWLNLCGVYSFSRHIEIAKRNRVLYILKAHVDTEYHADKHSSEY